ncbi:MAG: 7-cyano-7-deazaguanine synthase [Candidatus Thorarchaeota archaeon]|jgi:7-cyano-7-deazaguanine synthase
MFGQDLVVLYSGGADSYLMLQFALQLERKPYCLLIDYGQKHVKELDYARKQLDDLNLPYQVVKVSGLNVNSGLTGDNKSGNYKGVNPMNVPGRNTIFIGIAVSIAENKGIDEVWYGPDYSDRINLFPDCYQDYVVKMNEVLSISGVKPIKLVAPLLGWTKEMILQYLNIQYKITEKDLFSGYENPEDLL